MKHADFFLDNEISNFQKDLVKQALDSDGIRFMKNELSFAKKQYVEVYA
jgi:hypothetical protein